MAFFAGNSLDGQSPIVYDKYITKLNRSEMEQRRQKTVDRRRNRETWESG